MFRLIERIKFGSQWIPFVLEHKVEDDDVLVFHFVDLIRFKSNHNVGDKDELLYLIQNFVNKIAFFVEATSHTINLCSDVRELIPSLVNTYPFSSLVGGHKDALMATFPDNASLQRCRSYKK